MTELPTLRAAVRETAERRYARPRRARTLVAAACALAAAAAGLAIVSRMDPSQPADEVPATPTPTPALTVPAPSGSPRIPSVTPADPADPALRGLVSGEIVRAWSVPAMKGHVILSREGGRLCISAPDPSADQPDVQRGMHCGGRGNYGESMWIGDKYVAVVPDGNPPPRLELPDGTQSTLEPTDGLIALVHATGAWVTLYDDTGKEQRDRIG
jgi:hypothetical protein